MECRVGCGACCIAPSISTSFAGHPDGKPAGVRCTHLSPDLRCGIFGQPERPAVCSAFKADSAICGDNAEQAIALLGWLEQATA
ncbi:YkgJ family cysteine cluster protein [Stutzerimonas urumqiensis]|uniref:YkgJ family cysteine cluster protein n=1 Tax=Stutzerimonas urumqiensis TaxID=638269 RepID=UPI000EAF948C|nr:YkgJ family cysteine cluster protein [Stutzerimonas urumqiensis]